MIPHINRSGSVCGSSYSRPAGKIIVYVGTARYHELLANFKYGDKILNHQDYLALRSDRKGHFRGYFYSWCQREHDVTIKSYIY